MADNFEERDKAYQKFKKSNPDVSFAEFHAQKVLKKIALRQPLAQLGPRLTKHDDWHEAGKRHFETYRKRFSIPQTARVVDYGCGTLRVGAHFIEYLDPGCYFGLDVVADLLKIGKEMVGEEILREKSPSFGVISEERALSASSDFTADFVYSSSVCNHVHPDETPTYFGNLQRLTHKPGAVLFFDMIVAENPVPHRNLAWPLERYIEALPQLEFVKLHVSSEHEEEGQMVTAGVLEFRRVKSA